MDVGVGLFRLRCLNGQHALFGLDADVIGGESGKRHLDAVMFVIILGNVVGRVVRLLAFGQTVQFVEQRIEANKLAGHGCGKQSHVSLLFLSENGAAFRYGKAAFQTFFCNPFWRYLTDIGREISGSRCRGFCPEMALFRPEC
uniref:Predicted small heat shock protein n=1 Tax=uncultured bacterium MedeBAC46A06 TaxID=332275 RepID=Q4PJH1_9BACT|nr:predicted small heat shock protein [uncultured bacterium MedeBAC46A06]